MTEPQRDGGPRTVDEVNPNANYNSHLAKRYNIGHLIRRLRRHLPPEGKAGDRILVPQMKSNFVGLNVSPIPTLTHA